ncbi:MAG: hypothetical protein O3C57_03825, partial [Verrucomicrobia bacterium]|nr:hypothetical protein [Verrucomicrobiota bacterium]
MTLGSLISAPRFLKALWRGEALSGHFRNWFIASYAAGIFAIIPGVLRRLGLSNALCDGWWMNIFLFYPAINE